jgi:putative acetyltransferase
MSSIRPHQEVRLRTHLESRKISTIRAGRPVRARKLAPAIAIDKPGRIAPRADPLPHSEQAQILLGTMPESTVIRDEARADEPAIHEIHVLAFPGPDEARLVDALRQSGDAAISLVAVRGDRILGHILLSRLTAPMRALSLAPVAVRPEFQRRGIGSALVRGGLDRARRDGWEAVFVLGDVRYYSRFGFSVEAARGYLSPYTGEHFMMQPLGRGKIPAAGQLIYPAPFALQD